MRWQSWKGGRIARQQGGRFSNKTKEKTEQTRGGRGIGDNKNDMECGK